MCEQKSFEIKYPDTLVEIWKRFNLQESNLTEEEVGEAWCYISMQLTKEAESFIKVHNGSIADVKDLVEEMLSDLMKIPLGQVEVKTYPNLVRDLRKMIAKKNNPAGYELNDIINTALRELEKAKMIVRDAASKGKRISSLTSFKLVGSPDRDANVSDYEANASKIPMYWPKERGGSMEHSRIITPENARKLLLELLAVFNGWTSKGVLVSAALKHIPEDCMFKLESLPEERDDTRTEDERLTIMSKRDEDKNCYNVDSINDFYENQAQVIIEDKSIIIWNKACEISKVKFFCLYYIPEHFGNDDEKRTVLEDFGKTSTMGDQNTRLKEMCDQELKAIDEIRGMQRVTGLQREYVKYILNGIVLKLYRKCSENGYNPNLSYYESQMN